MKLGNSNIAFRKILNNGPESLENYEACTYKGVTIKTLIFLATAVLGAIIGIVLLNNAPEAGMIALIIFSCITFVSALIALVSLRLAKVFGIIYCIAEGMLVGVVSYICSGILQGAVSIALLSTVAVFAVVVLLFVSNVVKVNNKFMKFLSIFAISFIIVALMISLASLFIEISIGLSLAISAVTIFLATLYLFFDLEKIRQIVEGGYPKEYEWNAAFGLSFTLIWLYVEILELVIKLYSLFDRN